MGSEKNAVRIVLDSLAGVLVVENEQNPNLFHLYINTLTYIWSKLFWCFCSSKNKRKWEKELEALEREGTRLTRCAFDVVAEASIYRRAVAVLVATLPVASENAIRRKTTGTGRMRYLRHVPRRFKTGFREGTQATPRKKGAVAAS
ncbi:uncharacterized protein LOC105770556 isoform X1 [Gossypium raimondii]|uniref:uncharacterized protein LOC105770556 isoform X1 n=1 Tax=Gossypium raimondii TaxID=29730 RepID=UPI00227AD742|nr:uncharacterized protein LOC105770556 isoform X1 [Gossypium raimondii]